MDLILNRIEYRDDGVFGEILYGRNKDFLFCTLESPIKKEKTLISSIPSGSYKCVRGIYTIQGLEDPFETFKINIPDLNDCYFNIGHYSSNFPGSILIGTARGWTMDRGRMLMGSTKAFELFMKIQKDCNEFLLHIDP